MQNDSAPRQSQTNSIQQEQSTKLNLCEFNSKTDPPPHTLNIIRDKKTNRKTLPPPLVPCAERRRGAQLFKFHLGTLSTTFLIPRLGQLTCQPAHYRAESPLISAEFTSGQPPPTLQTALSAAAEGSFLCSAVKEDRERVK